MKFSSAGGGPQLQLSWLGVGAWEEGGLLNNTELICVLVCFFYVCVCSWYGGQRTTWGVVSSNTKHHQLFLKGLLLSWRFLSVLSWRISKPWGPACLHLPSSGIRIGSGIFHMDLTCLNSRPGVRKASSSPTELSSSSKFQLVFSRYLVSATY